MKRISAILFLSIYLFSTTELSQLFKLPAFVAHYKEHKIANSDLTLWKFLCIHYADTNKPDADHAKDMQLPFKTHDNCAAQINLSFPPTVFSISTQTITPPPEHQKQYFHHDVFVSSSFFANIWQPPKSC